MKPRPGYYSVIQYVPDASRMEAVNVGVVLFVPGETCLVTLSTDDARLLRFFPHAKPDYVHIAAESVVCRLKSEWIDWEGAWDLEQFIKLLANNISMTPPRPMTLREANGTELSRLFTELVEEP